MSYGRGSCYVLDEDLKVGVKVGVKVWLPERSVVFELQSEMTMCLLIVGSRYRVFEPIHIVVPDLESGLNDSRGPTFEHRTLPC